MTIPAQQMNISGNNQSEVQIRTATRHDVPLITMMTWEILVVTNRADRYRFEESLAGVQRIFSGNSQDLYILATVGSRVIGQLKLARQYNDLLMGDEAWIEHVFIHSEFRGRKIYDQLHAHAVALCQQWGAKRLSLHVVDTNERARRAYEKQGMLATGFWMTQSLEN
ncbi:GNAT family N-acetyltransferase [Gimesia sp.]|uniref:GNAT family N-acetyltransferase n=1 Tax=Gimesia sp. TaxID=2024833 RepID=UPI003A95C6C1